MLQDIVVKKFETVAIIAFGSNLRSIFGDPVANVDKAAELLQHYSIRILKMSVIYTTPSFPSGGPDYANGAAVVAFGGNAEELLIKLHEIESLFDRVRDERWGARTMDLDLLAVGQTVLPDMKTVKHWMDLALNEQATAAPVELILPHPRLQDRAFVLIPLADVAPDWVHPILKKTVSQMLNELPEDQKKSILPVRA